MERLGLGYTELSRHNSRLIYVAISGFGQHGPYALRAGHDLNYLALGGVLHALAGNQEIPSVPGVQIADVAGASYAVIGALLALAARQQTGQGQQVDVAILESILPLLTVALAEYTATGKTGGRGILLGRYACYNVYQTGDGRWAALGAVEEKFWASFCKAVGFDLFIQYQFDEER